MRICTRITEVERLKCRKVTDAFTELYEELGDMTVADAGNVGFVLLRYFNGIDFENNEIFTDSKELFEELWSEWLEHHLLTPVLGTPLAELDYEQLYEILPDEKKAEYEQRKQGFWMACFDR